MSARGYILNKVKQTLLLAEKGLDSTMIAAKWQRLKWCMKYMLGWQKYVPSLEVLKSRPHRQLLLNEIDRFNAVESVLEVGCGRGANLYLLAMRNSNIHLFGTDISEKAIEQAISEFSALGASISLSVAKAENLSAFNDKSVDVVISDAVLMYLPPKELLDAINEMLRVAKIGIVINAWHKDIPDSVQLWEYDEGAWVYDYNRLIFSLRGQKAAITSYPQGVWNDERWNKYGSLITACV